MQLSTRARYAVRAMIELSVRHGDGPVMLKDIAHCQEISDKYLEQLLAPLRAKGFIRTIRGNRGGYFLAKPAEEISLYDIIEVVEGSMAPVNCVDNPEGCSRYNICVTRDIWSRLKEVIVGELKSINLASLAKQHMELCDNYNQ